MAEPNESRMSGAPTANPATVPSEKPRPGVLALRLGGVTIWRRGEKLSDRDFSDRVSQGLRAREKQLSRKG